MLPSLDSWNNGVLRNGMATLPMVAISAVDVVHYLCHHSPRLQSAQICALWYSFSRLVLGKVRMATIFILILAMIVFVTKVSALTIAGGRWWWKVDLTKLGRWVLLYTIAIGADMCLVNYVAYVLLCCNHENVDDAAEGGRREDAGEGGGRSPGKALKFIRREEGQCSGVDN
ncbi:hypothetical protein U9M48_022302, partial [Paspalum notatum var. saurae]